MDGQDWQWPDDGPAEDAETADLGEAPGGEDLSGGGEVPFFVEDLGGEHDASGLGDTSPEVGGDFDALDEPLDEPLGTEDAAATFDQTVEDPDGGDADGGDPGGGDAGLGAADEYDDGEPAPVTDAAGPHDVAEPDVEGGVDPLAEVPFGGDPDLAAAGDDAGWYDTSFPPHLELADAPEPVDGYPWTDPATLGDSAMLGDAGSPGDYEPAYDGDGGALPADLAAYDGVEVPDGGDPWAALLGSEDPATSALARWWAS